MICKEAPDGTASAGGNNNDLELDCKRAKYEPVTGSLANLLTNQNIRLFGTDPYK
jgi:hypothetical protein